MKASKRGKRTDPKKSVVNSHLSALHQRLYQCLSLGFRYSKDEKRDWYTNDVEMQRQVIRSMSAFLDVISPDTVRSPLVKDSVADMVRAVGSILQSPIDAVLTMASEVVLKLIRILPTSLVQPHVGPLSHPLSSLLSHHQSQISMMSATALNLILLNLSVKQEKEMWEIFEKHDLLAHLVSNLQNFSDKVKPMNYFVEMASLLSSVMQLWPSTRYAVWSNHQLMKLMENFCSSPNYTLRAAILQLYSSLVLCGYGALKLIESGECLVRTIVQCMGNMQHPSVRILAFKVVQLLMDDEGRCTKVLRFSCETVVESIIHAMDYSSESLGENPDQELILEACRLALITRWPGIHHKFLWKLGVHKALFKLLMLKFPNVNHHQPCSVKELICVARDCHTSNSLLDLRTYVWEILGWLSAQCDEDFKLNEDGHEFHIGVLISSACLAFVESIGRKGLLLQADRAYMFRSTSAAKATLMMMYSPCNYIASQARLIVSELLSLEGVELKHLLRPFHFIHSEDTSRMPDELQVLISLMGLTCYSGLPQLYQRVFRFGGVKTLLAFVRWYLHNNAHERVSRISYLRGKKCCRIDMEDWEGREIHLLLALWCLAELANWHEAESLSADVFPGLSTSEKELLVQVLQDIQRICLETTSSGLRWYSSYLLSFFGFYGFSSKMGQKIASLICDEDCNDMYLVPHNGQHLSVHKVILLARCPSFLPPEDASNEETSISSSFLEGQITNQRTKKEVTLSAQVDEQALPKILEYMYSGCLQAEAGLVRKLKVLAKYCKIQPLLHLLAKKRPMWAASVPSFDLSAALGPAGRDISDVILVAESAEETGWTCNGCSVSVPHFHAHRSILCSSCNYMRALFQSGMQESHLGSIKVPVSWEALYKLVMWAYSNDIPKPLSGCIWDNMGTEKKMYELRPYIELCWLAEFWIIDDLRNDCLEVIAKFLDSSELSIRVIHLAAKFSQWEMVDVAANRIARDYGSLRVSGALDVLDEGLVELIRVASVRLSQELHLRS